MDNELMGNGNRERDQNEDSVKLMVNKKSDFTLLKILDHVNDGFESGRITRSQLGNWIITKFAEFFDENDLKDIRAAHFDELLSLEAMIKRAKEGKSIPAEISEILQEHSGFKRVKRGRKKRPLTNIFINDEIKKEVNKVETKRDKKDSRTAEPIAG